jgi:hypothetical protein
MVRGALGRHCSKIAQKCFSESHTFCARRAVNRGAATDALTKLDEEIIGNTTTLPGQAFVGDLRSTSGLGLGDGITTHTGKWLEVGVAAAGGRATAVCMLLRLRRCSGVDTALLTSHFYVCRVKLRAQWNIFRRQSLSESMAWLLLHTEASAFSVTKTSLERFTIL